MARKYPFEFMTEEDHNMLYNKMDKPKLDQMEGIWEGQLISDSAWTKTISIDSVGDIRTVILDSIKCDNVESLSKQ